MKVVINACHGGFSLSLAGEREYLARKGKEAFFYTNERKDKIDFDAYVRAVEGERHFCIFTFTSDKGDAPSRTDIWGEDGRSDTDYFNSRDIPRDDPDLIAVIEDMGRAASGDHAKLEVIEIPDGVDWIVEEYDGYEHIAEAHRTWS